jgi:hypothetical protein
VSLELSFKLSDLIGYSLHKKLRNQTAAIKGESGAACRYMIPFFVLLCLVVIISNRSIVEVATENQINVFSIVVLA